MNYYTMSYTVSLIHWFLLYYFFRKKNIEITVCISVLKMKLSFWKKKIKKFRSFTIADLNLCNSTILWNHVYSWGLMFKMLLFWLFIKRWLFNALNKNIKQIITLLFCGENIPKILFKHKIELCSMTYTFSKLTLYDLTFST